MGRSTAGEQAAGRGVGPAEREVRGVCARGPRGVGGCEQAGVKWWVPALRWDSEDMALEGHGGQATGPAGGSGRARLLGLGAGSSRPQSPQEWCRASRTTSQAHGHGPRPRQPFPPHRVEGLECPAGGLGAAPADDGLSITAAFRAGLREARLLPQVGRGGGGGRTGWVWS